MSYKILTNYTSSLEALIHDPYSILDRAEKGTVAIFIKNVPVFYALTPKRLKKLLEIETNILRSSNNLILDNNLYEIKSKNIPSIAPIGKFNMYPGWHPDRDFQRMAALWGISIKQPITTEELAAFVSYWQMEEKVFYHIQWQQKLARSIQIRRSNANHFSRYFRHDTNIFSEPDKNIPKGFRGAK